MQITIDIEDNADNKNVVNKILTILEKYKNQGVKIVIPTIQTNDYQLPNEVQQQVRDIESRFDKIRNAPREADETLLPITQKQKERLDAFSLHDEIKGSR